MRLSAPRVSNSFSWGTAECENSASEGRSMARSLVTHEDSRLFIQFSVLALTAIISFFLGRRWSDGHPQLAFFSGTGDSDAAARFALPPLSVSFSPNLTFDSWGLTSNAALLLDASPPPLDAYPPPPWQREVGIVDGNGTMRVDFDAEDFDPDVASGWDDGGLGNNETVAKASDEEERVVMVKIDRFKVCPESAKDWIPCMDSEVAIEGFHSTQLGERYERHCPPPGKGLDCLVPAPKGYKKPIPWPQSRDEVWFSNVPHTQLVEYKGGQIWIPRDKKKFKFPGGVTQFIHGANEYLDQISRMVPDIAFGLRTRVVLDVGSGVASFGAFLLSRNVITMSTAPRNVHENQIQFVLERGVPAMVAALATHRLPYPSQAFDLIHCSRCRINWTRDDGILLLEVNRLLRAGGYFVWAAQPVYKHEEIQQETGKDMEDLTARICWQLVKKEGYIAIWQKPLNNSCYIGRSSGVQPLLCDTEDHPDAVWYVNLKTCITRLPENGYDGNVPSWPARLHEPPQRLQEFGMDAFLAKNELFRTESDYWNEIVERHIRIFHWKKMRPRNVMDMRAGFGGYAAALINQQIDCWVMNVVPVSGPNTLPVIYDRGLIGVNHDWCEPFDTYPRTYDLLHASDLFSRERKRCNISGILLEMDRILRPRGNVYIRDSKYIMEDILEITRALGWRTNLRDTHEGPYANRKLLVCQKPFP